MTRLRTQLCWNSSKTLQHCCVKQNCWSQCCNPTLDRAKNVGRTSSNMGGQTVEQRWIEQSWSVESIQLCSIVWPGLKARTLMALWARTRTQISKSHFRPLTVKIRCDLILTRKKIIMIFISFIFNRLEMINGFCTK